MPTVLEALAGRVAERAAQRGARVRGRRRRRPGFADAVAAAARADVAVVVVGDQSGLFGRGTVGEGCDRDDLELPGVQRELVEAVLDTGTPVVLVLLTGRPYAVGWALDRCAAVVQAFFPGEEGGAAVAGVLSGRVNPSGRLPVSLPRSAGAQPYSYLHPALGGRRRRHQPVDHARPCRSGTACPTPRSGTSCSRCTPATTCEPVVARVRVTNTGARAGADVVQLYGRDVVGSRHPPGGPAARLPPGAPRAGCRRPRSPSRFRPRGWPSPTAPAAAWSSPASCGCGSAPASTTGPGPRRSTLTGEVHVVTPRDERWTIDPESGTMTARHSEPAMTPTTTNHEPTHWRNHDATADSPGQVLVRPVDGGVDGHRPVRRAVTAGARPLGVRRPAGGRWGRGESPSTTTTSTRSTLTRPPAPSASAGCARPATAPAW